MACGGGIQNRIKKVTIPIRGAGKCPAKKHPDRFEEQECNAQACVGDEICIAKQDLVIALDGSGSLKESGFEILRDLAANLTGRYESKYYGMTDTLLGVVAFGNGHVMADGSVAPALTVQGLTGDMALVKEKIEALEWQKGFTNMAQAFLLADTLLSAGGRPEAQSAVLVISDGKYSFQFQTAQQVEKMKDAGIYIFMAPVSEGKNDHLDVLKTWATQPWETNYERIPGFQALKYNPDTFAQKLVSKFCPKAISPSSMKTEEETNRFMLVHESGMPNADCASIQSAGIRSSPESCAGDARLAGFLAFAFGKGRMEAGHCQFLTIPMTEALWEEFQANRHDPECPDGAWEDNPYFDVYAMLPLQEVF